MTAKPLFSSSTFLIAFDACRTSTITSRRSGFRLASRQNIQGEGEYCFAHLSSTTELAMSFEHLDRSTVSSVKVLDTKLDDGMSEYQYFIHYDGWNKK